MPSSKSRRKAPKGFSRYLVTPVSLALMLRRASALVWGADPLMASLLALLSLAQGVIPAVQLLVTKRLIDVVAAVLSESSQGSSTAPGLVGLVALQACVFVLASGLAISHEYFRNLLGERLRNDLSLRVLTKASSLEISFFEDAGFYDRLQNAYQETGSRPLDIVLQVFALGQTFVSLLSVALMLLARLDVAIVAVVFISTLPVLLVQTHFGTENYWLQRDRTPALRKQSYLGAILSSSANVKDVRVFHLEDYFISRYRSLFSDFLRQTMRLLAARSRATMVTVACSNAGWLVAAVYLVGQVEKKAITVGDFALFTQAVGMAQAEVEALLSSLSGLYSNSLFMQNLFEYLHMPARDLSRGKALTQPIEEVEFRNVSFTYPGTTRLALDNVSFMFRRGESVALVGPNGAGKTTLAKLLCRLYEPTAGEILINGHAAAEFSPQSTQDQIAVLFQDYGRYHLTARENIALGRISRVGDNKSIREAAGRSEIASTIEALPQGYDTILGRWFEGGCELSVGEWQRLALARIELRSGSLVVLDEPFASLDPASEFAIFQRMIAASSSRMTLLISHRFSSVLCAQNILVFEEGRCIEAGTHEDLLRSDGKYASLFRLQAQPFIETLSRNHALS